MQDIQSNEVLAEAIVKGMQNLKASKIIVLDLRELENSVCEFFVICQGSSNTQVNGICDSVEKIVREDLKDKPYARNFLEDKILM